MTDLRAQLQSALGDSYTLDRELGGGGMSHVFLATERALQRQVVIKVVRPELAEGLSAERFAREVRLSARLQQANIVPVLSAGDAGGIPWYSMPFVRGESLRVRLQRDGAVPLTEAVNILRDVARALAFAHGDGVLHRDIKPENILLSGGTTVVADFGIAKAVSAARTTVGDGPSDAAPSGTMVTQVGMSVGTPAYMAPEQALGDPATDHRADIYAWGVVAYELLAGKHPFADHTTAQALVAAHIKEAPRPFASKAIPPQLQALVLDALEKDPARRPQTAEELVRDLDAAVAAPGGVEATPAHHRTRWLVGAAIALTSLAIIAMVASISSSGSGSRPAGGADESRSVVVMPFENLGPATDAYFADGLAEEIGARLGQIPGIRVVGRASAARFRDSATSLEKIGRELGAAYILRGSVRWERATGGTKDTTMVRIVSTLVRASTGEQLWGEPVTQRLTDVFKVQAEVAERVAAALSVQMASSTRATVRRADTQDPVAREAVLLGRNLLAKRGAANITAAIGEFNRAIARDSNYARAWAGLGEAQAVSPTYGLALNNSGAAAARRAIQLDSQSSEAWTAYAASLSFEVHLRDALAAAYRAVALDASSAAAQGRLGMILMTMGRVDEAEKPLRMAIQLDPFVAPYTSRLSSVFAARRQADSLVAIAKIVGALDPTNGTLRRFIAGSLVQLGRVADAIEVCTATGEPKASCERTYTVLTDPAQRSAALAMLAAPERSDPSSIVRQRTFRAAAYAHVGEKDAAFALLDDIFRNGLEAALFALINAPWFETLHGDPRWASIVEAGRR
jgi:serine/threonine-protein kinase